MKGGVGAWGFIETLGAEERGGRIPPDKALEVGESWAHPSYLSNAATSHSFTSHQQSTHKPSIFQATIHILIKCIKHTSISWMFLL